MPTANPEELTRFNKIIQLVVAMFSDLLAVLKKRQKYDIESC